MSRQQTVHQFDDCLNFVFPPEFKNYLISKKEYDHASFDTLSCEFKKFVVVSLTTDSEMPMLSPEVDRFWHEFILTTPLYVEFGERYCGGYFHHLPTMDSEENSTSKCGGANCHKVNKTTSPIEPRSKEQLFVDEYQRLFGSLHPIWELNKESNCGGSGCGACSNLANLS